MTDLQRIRVQRCLDPPQCYSNHSSSSQDSQGARGRFGLKQTTPPMGLSAPELPLPRRAMPDFARCVARPRRETIEIGHDRPIGQLEHSQNWWAGGLE
jgi:hypothetical protein